MAAMMSISAQRSALILVLVASLSIVTGQLDCISSFSNTTNYFPYGYSPSEPFALPVTQTIETAEKFSVQYNNAYKLLFNTFSNTSYLLYQCGAPVSNDYNASLKPIQIPVTAAAIDSTIPIGYFELLGLLPLLKATSEQYTSPYATSPCFQKLIETDQIEELNSSSTDFADFSGLVFSALQMQPEYDSNFVSFDASQDPGPLRRAEWIKYLAVFFNAEEKATEIYNQIEANYQCLNGTSNLTTNKPVVVWISEYPMGVLTLSNATYKTQLTADAGGLNIDASDFGSYNLSVATEAARLYSVLAGVDVVIDEIFSVVPSAYNLTTFLETLRINASDDYPFLVDKRVWREDRRLQKDSLGLDWYEGSLPQPQIVLQELLGIFNPSINHTHHFFRNIAEGEQVVPLTADNCTASDPAAALSPTIYTCPTKEQEIKAEASPPPPPTPESSGSMQSASPMAAGVLTLLISVWVGLAAVL